MAANWLSGAGSLIGAVGGLFGGATAGSASARQYRYNLALQQQAQDWNERMYKNRYQMQVKDLEKAGINKLYGLGTAPSVTNGMNAVGLEDDQGAKNKKTENAINALGVATNWTAKKVEMKKMEAETATENVNAQLKSMEVVSQELDNLYKKKDLDSYDKRLKSELEEQKSRISKNLADASTASSVIANNLSSANMNRVSARKMNQDIQQSAEITAGAREQSKAEEAFLKKYPKLRGAVGGAKALSGIFQGVATAGGLGLGGIATYNSVKNSKNQTARNNRRR